MNDQEPFYGVFSDDASKVQLHTIANMTEDDCFAIARSTEFIDFVPGAKINAELEFLVNLTGDDGVWTTRPDTTYYKFESKTDAEFIMHRLIALRQGSADLETHAAELRLSMTLVDLYTGGNMKRAESVGPNDVLRLEKVLVNQEDEDPLIMYAITGLKPNLLGSVERQFLCTTSSVSPGQPEWTDDLGSARYFFSKQHALDSARWIMLQGSIGYHRMGNPLDTLYQEIAGGRPIEQSRLRLTDTEGRVASFCFFTIKSKSMKKTSISRDISGVDDSFSSSTNRGDAEFARYMLNQRAVYVNLTVMFQNEDVRRFKVESMPRRAGRYLVTAREIIDGSKQLGHEVQFEIDNVAERSDLPNIGRVLISGECDANLLLDQATGIVHDSEEV